MVAWQDCPKTWRASTRLIRTVTCKRQNGGGGGPDLSMLARSGPFYFLRAFTESSGPAACPTHCDPVAGHSGSV